MKNDTKKPQKTPQITEISQKLSPQQKKHPKTKWLILLIVIVVIFGGHFALAYIINLWPFSTQQQQPVDLSQQKTEPATGESEFSQEIVDKARAVGIEARKSVIYLEIRTGDGSGGGATAFFLEGGLLLTAGHNVKEAVTIKGYTIDGDTFSVEVINWSHIPLDVAVLRTNYSKAPGLPVRVLWGIKGGRPTCAGWASGRDWKLGNHAGKVCQQDGGRQTCRNCSYLGGYEWVTDPYSGWKSGWGNERSDT